MEPAGARQVIERGGWMGWVLVQARQNWSIDSTFILFRKPDKNSTSELIVWRDFLSVTNSEVKPDVFRQLARVY